MIPHTWRRHKSLKRANAFHAQWAALLNRFVVTDAPAELDQVETALDAEALETIDKIIVVLAVLVTFAWTAFLIVLLLG